MAFTIDSRLQEQLPERIDEINALIERREAKLAQWEETAETELDFKRVRKLTERIARAKRIRDELTGQLEAPEPSLPKDEIEIATSVDDKGIGWFTVKITNSPYDNTYVPNDPLILKYNGCAKDPGLFAAKRCVTKRRGLASGDYWTEGPIGTQEFVLGSKSFAKLFEDYDTNSLTLGRDLDPDGPMGTVNWMYETA